MHKLLQVIDVPATDRYANILTKALSPTNFPIFLGLTHYELLE